MQKSVQFRAGGDLLEALSSRAAKPNLACRRDIARYYHLLTFELRSVELTEAEAMLICDAQNGVLSDFILSPQWMLLHGVTDAIALENLDKKWGVDREALTAKLEALAPGQAAAVIDAVERFWHEPESYHIDDPKEKLIAVGLINKPE